MNDGWIRQQDGSHRANGRYVWVEVRQARDTFFVVSGGAMRGGAHRSLESAKASALTWLALLDDVHRPAEH
ncbi:hypothetical protein GCM10009841_21660 [Microlunatus panaciterrae]|uniref:DRBM domain-containing protein n=1 Tax=Microlunatus panaciterrae TaxID=400768 RepID=A0ABS2RNY3_9ACTN|nr:hypothetical protein [Microlunatus panaciterrae]MBM7800720.1 hypothetical protein [Microlunatus panaciterrae]